MKKILLWPYEALLRGIEKNINTTLINIKQILSTSLDKVPLHSLGLYLSNVDSAKSSVMTLYNRQKRTYTTMGLWFISSMVLGCLMKWYVDEFQLLYYLSYVVVFISCFRILYLCTYKKVLQGYRIRLKWLKELKQKRKEAENHRYVLLNHYIEYGNELVEGIQQTIHNLYPHLPEALCIDAGEVVKRHYDAEIRNHIKIPAPS